MDLQFVNNHGIRHLSALVDQKVVGRIEWIEYNGVAIVQRLVVEREHRGKGIGKALIDGFRQRAPKYIKASFTEAGQATWDAYREDHPEVTHDPRPTNG